MAGKRVASQAQRRLTRPPRFLQAYSSRESAGRGPHSAKGAEPNQGRLGGNTYRGTSPATVSMSLSPQPGTQDQLNLWGRILEAFPPWLPPWAPAKPTFMMRKTFTENNSHLAKRQRRE